MLDLAGGIAGQRDDTETSQSAHGLPGSNEELKTGGIFIGDLGDAGEMLDEQAKVAYRRRLSELREELEEAKELVSQGARAATGGPRADKTRPCVEICPAETSRHFFWFGFCMYNE